jgi:hypothetical protein
MDRIALAALKDELCIASWNARTSMDERRRKEHRFLSQPSLVQSIERVMRRSPRPPAQVLIMASKI